MYVARGLKLNVFSSFCTMHILHNHLSIFVLGQNADVHSKVGDIGPGKN